MIDGDEEILKDREERRADVAIVAVNNSASLSEANLAPVPAILEIPDEPLPRTAPVKMLEPRKRRLERQPEEKVPEIHIVGEIRNCSGSIQSLSDGLLCRWKFECSKIWQHLGGETSGQSHVGYAKYSIDEPINISHPIDMHFAVPALQGFGASRIVVQSFRLDWFGRRVLVGYGFAHVPLNPGSHLIEIPMWRPLGTPEQEVRALMLDETPSLLRSEPVYESAWKDRCRLITTSCGTITAQVSIITRFMKEQGMM